jgi:LPXTG-motif cell wall-anchored protein
MPASVSPRAQWFARMRVTLGALLLTLVAASALVVSGSGTPAAAQLTCAQGGECELGDIGPGGGVVFFVKGTGAFSASRYFPDLSSICVVYGYMCYHNTVSVALTSGEQTALPFDYIEVAPQSGEANRVWNGGGRNITVANTTLIGTGAVSSQAIIDADAASPADYAAAYAMSYSNNGLDDWYLPSYDELSLILIRQAVDGGAMGTFYANMWSSTQSDTSNARARSFTNGQALWVTKNAASIGARPVRSFSAAPVVPTTTTAAPTTTTAAPASTTTTAAPVTPTTVALTEAGVAPLPTRSLGVAATVQGGQEVTVRGSGFAAGALIDVYVASEPVLLGRVTANLDGTFALDVTLPSGLSGAHSIVVYDPTTGAGFRQSIQIEGNSLAITGGTNDGLMLALGLLMAGAACTVVARRRTITD